MVLKQVCILEWSSDRLKMSENTFASCLAQVIRMRPVTPSGPVALYGCTLGKVLLEVPYVECYLMTKKKVL